MATPFLHDVVRRAAKAASGYDEATDYDYATDYEYAADYGSDYGYTTEYDSDFGYATGYDNSGGYAKDAGYGKAKDKDAYDFDYAVLSVVVLTLGLLLFVETVFHHLEHSAHHRPFFKAVLDHINSELATLGVVELVVHILLTYHNNIDKKKKAVFADVHFAIFYTAVLNAFQTVFIAMVAIRVSQRQWAQCEEVELNHYVEIREEFDRVDRELHGNKENRSRWSITGEQSVSMGEQLRKYWEELVETIKYPRLKRIYDKLLVQKRFHELRVHFLQAYDLPLGLKISGYLRRSEQDVLIKLVHVSAASWLWLTAGANLLYFLMGIFTEVTKNYDSVNQKVAWLLASFMIGFIFVSIVIYFKMRSIYGIINHMDLFWGSGESDQEVKGAADTTTTDRAIQQKNLFWFGQPKLIIAAVQFMQFGYALAVSLLVVYWDTVEEGGPFKSHYYLIAMLIFYMIFVMIMAQVIPMYTLCTNLGQLVDRKRLNETVALFRLEQTELARRNKMLDDEDDNDDDDIHNDNIENSLMIVNNNESSVDGENKMKGNMRRVTSVSSISTSSSEEKREDRAALLAAMVKSDTVSLRSIVDIPDMSNNSDEKQQGKRKFRKTLSDGVGSMKNLMAPIEESESLMPELKKYSNGRTRLRKTASDGVGMMQMMADINEKDEELEKSGHGERHTVSLRRTSSMDDMDLLDTSLNRRELLNKPIKGNNNDSKKSIETSFKKNKMVKRNSMGSVSGRSDVDDIPEIDSNSIESMDHHHDHPHWKDKLRSYFLSTSYVNASNLFGTMVSFFLVGTRIEGFVHEELIIPWGDNSFGFTLEGSFWFQVTWYILYIFGSVLIFYLFLPTHMRNEQQKTIVLAAVFDVIISVICLCLLLVAESERCCTDSDNSSSKGYSNLDTYDDRRLADYINYNSGYDNYGDDLDCCASFGWRTYSGLGNIEPFTGLVALRSLRFYFARKYIQMNTKKNRTKLMFESEYTENDSSSSGSPKHDDHGDNHGHGHGHHGSGGLKAERGSMVELWEKGISNYPDIVAKYGEFSSELFQAMLGVDIIEEKRTTKHSAEGGTTKTSASKTSKTSTTLSAASSSKPVNVELTPQGPSVGFYGGPTTMMSIDDFAATPHFNYPHAKLVRSMRRCEKKFLPYCVENWIPVDVVMTRYEIVYFEAVGVDNSGSVQFYSSEHDLETERKRKDMKETLVATKGGKGLRLCDVSAGRKMVGHLSFSDIISVHVERDVADLKQQTKAPEEDEEEKEEEAAAVVEDDDAVRQTEYWQPTHISYESREDRWKKVDEDRLKVETSHGTLILRFFADLEDSEAHPERHFQEREGDGPICKDNALQWAQTIVRFCGRNQLKQALPHFGSSGDAELRDYLQIVPNNNETSSTKKSESNFLVHV